ncbi:hypothetical protein IC762_08525 [Bradyrhizobium genosp. L]|uniref:hypothetical protein n=1 Tax=Bradyrhizobium genosp. L TaxID=83637 RepID=UPI0018A2D22A|nr:hypothetical protein [Bradyrhizobium genosp. L]QPF86313.1 hypothetical protein IC762_08525 [Bradyrhizobium genosp. L]
MRAILFIVCGLVLANIVTATFFWSPAATPGPAKPIVNSATQQGQDSWMVNEQYQAPHRELTRKAALEALDQPWSSHCTAEGHERLIRTIDYYYQQRSALAWSYGRTYGEEARRYAIKAWTTTDDNRIERLMSETYGRGYFTLGELKADARDALSRQVEGVRVSARPCAS